jgi:hypothetical protein
MVKCLVRFRRDLNVSSDDLRFEIASARCKQGVLRESHSFDNSDLPPAVVQSRGLNWTRCRFGERAAGEIANAGTNQAFSLSDSCLREGRRSGTYRVRTLSPFEQ